MAKKTRKNLFAKTTITLREVHGELLEISTTIVTLLMVAERIEAMLRIKFGMTDERSTKAVRLMALHCATTTEEAFAAADKWIAEDLANKEAGQ